jgi:hypothetical protein
MGSDHSGQIVDLTNLDSVGPAELIRHFQILVQALNHCRPPGIGQIL